MTELDMMRDSLEQKLDCNLVSRYECSNPIAIEACPKLCKSISTIQAVSLNESSFVVEKLETDPKARGILKNVEYQK